MNRRDFLKAIPAAVGAVAGIALVADRPSLKVEHTSSAVRMNPQSMVEVKVSDDFTYDMDGPLEEALRRHDRLFYSPPQQRFYSEKYKKFNASS